MVPTISANGALLPALGFGTWRLRGEECVAAVETALGAGYTHIDTAAMYENEREVGEAVRASGRPRDQVFVTTKVWYTELEPRRLLKSAEASVERLGLGAVDLLLIHWPDTRMPVATQVERLCRAKQAGLTRAIGVSNFTSAMLDEAARAADEPLACNQVEYHPYLDQDVVLAACRRLGMALVSYAPIARGDVLDEPVVTEIARDKGKTPAQVVLRWHVEQEGVAAIPKSALPARIHENIDIFDFSLDADEMARISALRRPDGRTVTAAWAPAWDAPANR